MLGIKALPVSGEDLFLLPSIFFLEEKTRPSGAVNSDPGSQIENENLAAGLPGVGRGSGGGNPSWAVLTDPLGRARKFQTSPRKTRVPRRALSKAKVGFDPKSAPSLSPPLGGLLGSQPLSRASRGTGPRVLPRAPVRASVPPFPRGGGFPPKMLLRQ